MLSHRTDPRKSRGSTQPIHPSVKSVPRNSVLDSSIIWGYCVIINLWDADTDTRMVGICGL